jgi:hypothetical protein
MALNVYPMGTTIYYPEKCWNGYTIFQTAMHSADAGAVLIDMNGNVVNLWQHLDGFPNKMLPGGCVMGSTGMRDPKFGYQDMLDLVQVDWSGNIVWRFNHYNLIKDADKKAEWMARQHHDYQLAGNPVGYYVPGSEPSLDKGNLIILCHKNLTCPAISDKLLLDDTIIEVTREGEIVWEWKCSDHFEEMGFDESAKNALARNPDIVKSAAGGAGDWMHVNSVSLLGPNKWYDAGDVRFHPDNIILDGRQTNIILIIDKKTGKIVWQIGPDYTTTPELRRLGQIIGQHHAHMIPRGLPGEGNILVFDNGGAAGYGVPNPGSLTGVDYALRDYSRVLEFEPANLKIVWQYSPREARLAHSAGLYSFFVSSAQRLPNGNTLINEGANGRIFEVTAEHETVWEYINEYRKKAAAGPPPGPLEVPPGMAVKGGSTNAGANMVYRAYRLPYDWVPQVPRPEEKAIPRIDNRRFRVPGSPRRKAARITKLKGNRG